MIECIFSGFYWVQNYKLNTNNTIEFQIVINIEQQKMLITIDFCENCDLTAVFQKVLREENMRISQTSR